MLQLVGLQAQQLLFSSWFDSRMFFIKNRRIIGYYCIGDHTMSNMDLLDLFGGAANPGKKAQNDANEKEGASIEIMSQVGISMQEEN